MRLANHAAMDDSRCPIQVVVLPTAAGPDTSSNLKPDGSDAALRFVSVIAQPSVHVIDPGSVSDMTEILLRHCDVVHTHDARR
jgi:hypothetical protein